MCPNFKATHLAIDTMETYFDSHLDLLQRRLSKQSDKLKMKAEETFNDVFKKDLFKIKAPSGDIEREMQKFKLKVPRLLHPIPVARLLTKSPFLR